MNEERQTYVRIISANHLALHGQVGNMRVTLLALQHKAVDCDCAELVAAIDELAVEVEYFGKYLPPLFSEVPYD